MLPPKNQLPPEQQRLLKVFRQLAKPERQSLLDYAEFLLQRERVEAVEPTQSQEPMEIPRPPSETVVAAIRRLSKSYHMLDKDELLHEASDLMSAHIMQGRPADQVIDELELVFHRHYERQKAVADEQGRR